ncbi:MAG: hypothetical protein ACKVYV_13580 [Limisphaerales bacterium]
MNPLTGSVRVGWLPRLAGVLLLAAMRLTAVQQTLDWTSPTNGARLRLGQSHPLTATASSGLPVTFRVVSGPAAVVGRQLVAQGPGSGPVVVRAEQAGNAQFVPVSEERTVTVEKTAQTLTWSAPAPGTRLRLGMAEALVASASSGLPVTFRVLQGSARVEGNQLTLTAPGTLLVLAEQAGDEHTAPVSEVRMLHPSDVQLTRVWAGSTPGHAQAVAKSGPLLHVAAGAAGLEILDVSDPASPVRAGGLDTAGTAYDVQVVGNLAFVADGESGLRVVDVSNPVAPVPRGGYDTPGLAQAVHVRDRVAFVADWTGGLVIVDVANPDAPVAIGGYPAGPFRGVDAVTSVKVEGNIAYVGEMLKATVGWNPPVVVSNALNVVDVSNPWALGSLGRLFNFGPPGDVVLDAGRIGVAEQQGGVRILDRTVPEAPVVVGRFDTPGTAMGLRLRGHLAFVSDGAGGIQAWDLTLPSAPRLAGSHPTAGFARRALVEDDLIYSAETYGGLQILRHETGIRPQVTFDVPAEVQLPAGPLALIATADTGRPVAISVVSGPAIWDGRELRFADAGQVVLRAEVAAGDGFTSAREERTIRAWKLEQRLVAFQPSPPWWQPFLAPEKSYPVGAELDSGLPVTVRVLGGPGVIADGVLTTTGVGTLTLVVENAGSDAYLRFRQELTLPVQQRAQRIAWQQPGGSLPVGHPQPLVAAIEDGLPVTFRLVSGPGVITGDTLTATDYGTLVVVMENAGSAEFLPFREERSFASTRLQQTVSWTAPAAGEVLPPGKVHPLVATASSGLPVNLRVLSGPGLVQDAALTITGPGTITLLAEQAGTAGFFPASALLTVNLSDLRLPLGATWPGHPRGEAYDVAFAGELVLVAAGTGGLAILDASRPEAPQRLGGLATAGEARSLQVGGTHAYLATGEGGLEIMDLRDPAAPVPLGRLDTPGFALDVHLAGTLAYVADAQAGLQIVDVGDPGAPVRVGGVDTVGFARGVWVTNGLACVADDVAGLLLLDVANPAAPMLRGRFRGNGTAWAVQVADGLAYLADALSGLQIVSLADPGTPVRVGTYDTPGIAYGMWRSGDLMYLADGPAGVHVLDVADPAAPVRVGGLDTPGTAHALAAAGTRLAVADVADGVQLLDITTPSVPALLGMAGTAGRTRGLALAGTLAYLADGAAGLRILDLGDPDRPAALGVYNTPGSAEDVKVLGNLAYVADGAAGLQVVDVSNPAAPVWVGGHDTPGHALGLEVDGALAFVADGGAGLQIFSVTNPAAPARLGSYDTRGSATAVQVVGGTAYLADGLAGLLVLDVSRPTTPLSLGALDTPGSALAVQVVGNLAYVADGTAGLAVVSVEYPQRPQLLRVEDTAGTAEGVRIDAARAYVADGAAGLLVFDLTAPAAPVLLAGTDTPGVARRVAVLGRAAAVADDVGGLRLVKIEDRIRQSLEFALWPFAVATDAPVLLEAKASSGLPVTFRVLSGPARVAGGRIEFTGAGTVVVRATQAGDQLFSVAELDRTVEVTLGQQTVSWQAPAEAAVLPPGRPVQLQATASSGLPVTYHLRRGPGLLVEGVLTATNFGTLLLEAVQAGDSRRAPAQATRIFNQQEAALSPVGSTGMPLAARAIKVVGRLAYLALESGGLEIFDVADPVAPRRLGGVDTPGNSHDVAVQGPFAYLADGDAGLQVVDVGDPGAPRLVGTLDLPGLSSGVRVRGTVAYVADGFAGLHVVDVSDPARPARHGSLITSGNPLRLDVANGLAYVASFSEGLLIVDVSDPANPVVRGTAHTGGVALDVQVVGDWAYVANGGGLSIIDVRDSAAPVLVANHPASLHSSSVTVVDGLAYLGSASPQGLAVFDVREPAVPTPAGAYMPGDIVAVEVVGDLVYATSYTEGLRILRRREATRQNLMYAAPPTFLDPAAEVDLSDLFATDSGLPVSLSLVSGPGILTGNRLRPTQPGSVIVRAEQAGNAQFLPAAADILYSFQYPIRASIRPAGTNNVQLSWTGGLPPFEVQYSQDGIYWWGISSSADPFFEFPIQPPAALFRVRGSR